MWNSEYKDIWKDIKDTWNAQPQSEIINIQVSKLVDEFKSKISQFEKDSINSDLAFINASATRFEKESIKKDLNRISVFVKKIMLKLKKRNNN